MINPHQIADYFLHLSNECGSLINNSKLQKLLYYSQAWYLAIYNKPLFEEDFLAWVHGPILPSIYEEYKRFSWKPIDKEVTKANLPKEIQQHLVDITEVYFGLSDYDLGLMIKQEDPWVITREGLQIDEPCDLPITKDLMREYYASRINHEFNFTLILNLKELDINIYLEKLDEIGGVLISKEGNLSINFVKEEPSIGKAIDIAVKEVLEITPGAILTQVIINNEDEDLDEQ